MSGHRRHPSAKIQKTNHFRPAGGRSAPGGLPGPQSDNIGGIGDPRTDASLAAANAPVAPMPQAGDDPGAGVA
jgi:hypothetical protein